MIVKIKVEKALKIDQAQQVPQHSKPSKPSKPKREPSPASQAWEKAREQKIDQKIPKAEQERDHYITKASIKKLIT